MSASTLNRVGYGPRGTSPRGRVLLPLDIEACAPGELLVPGRVMWLTQAARLMDLEPGGLCILCPSPGDEPCRISLLAGGIPMTSQHIELTGAGRSVPGAALRAGFRQLPASTCLEARVDAMGDGPAAWRGLRVVFLPVG